MQKDGHHSNYLSNRIFQADDKGDVVLVWFGQKEEAADRVVEDFVVVCLSVHPEE